MAPIKIVSKVIPQQAEVAQGVPGRLRPHIFLDVRHYKGGRSSPLRTGCLYPRRNPCYSFLEIESTPGHMVPSGATEKIPSDTTGNRSRDLPTSSAVEIVITTNFYILIFYCYWRSPKVNRNHGLLT
jgi:hypothetical protein